VSFEKYKEEYYVGTMKRCFGMAEKVSIEYSLPIACAIFEKVATPLVYLKEEYDKQNVKPKKSTSKTIVRSANSPSNSVTVKKVQEAFPEPIRKILFFEDYDDCVIVKPRQYLGSDNFKRVANIVKGDVGGEYVSLGKDSHFRVPKKEK
jgi:hypothetical protein